jgi:hypothetical protein
VKFWIKPYGFSQFSQQSYFLPFALCLSETTSYVSVSYCLYRISFSFFKPYTVYRFFQFLVFTLTEPTIILTAYKDNQKHFQLSFTDNLTYFNNLHTEHK